MIGADSKDDRPRVEWMLLRYGPNGNSFPGGAPPPGCKYHEHWLRGEISPELTGFLPAEAKWNEKKTHSKSYDPANMNDVYYKDNLPGICPARISRGRAFMIVGKFLTDWAASQTTSTKRKLTEDCCSQ